jgi:hypothetical protein
LLLPPSPVASSVPPPLLCASFQFLVYCSVLFCFCGGVSFCPGGYAGLFQRLLWEYCVTLGAQQLVCRMSPRQVWSWSLAALVALLFSQFNVAWRVEKLSMGWGFRVSKFWFCSVLYFCQGWLQHLSKIFDSRSSHCLPLHPSCHLGSLEN